MQSKGSPVVVTAPVVVVVDVVVVVVVEVVVNVWAVVVLVLVDLSNVFCQNNVVVCVVGMAPVLEAASGKQLSGMNEKKKSLLIVALSEMGPVTSSRTGKLETRTKRKLAAWFSCTGPGASAVAGSTTSLAMEVSDTPCTPPDEVPA